ncbi:unnamed protein product [Candidula unifasciata]|uniref:Centromere protein N n=1 Tax=Candidula unifasciata TaxID=100452 RepID=A0A8S3Z9C9_9EUPU|nr:unnamed protein product [Candidula unifasciata]
MDLQREIITSVISRCRVSSVRETLACWDRLSSSQLNNSVFKNGTKRKMVEHLVEFVQENRLNDDILGDLELVYMQLHSRRKIWLVYQLLGNDVSLNLDPRTLRSKFLKSLQLKWKDGRVLGNMRVFAGAVWLRMNLGQSMIRGGSGKLPRVYNPNHSVFIVTFPGSPYVFINKAAPRLLNVVTEGVVDALNADSLKDIKLSGHQVSSLADIVLTKNSKSMLNRYREQEDRENPLLVGQERKRKAVDPFTETEGLVDEERQQKRIKRVVLEKKLGSEPQPVLETLDYKFNVDFHGQELSGMKCSTSVEIKGTSVLNGLYQIAASGLVKFPLPKHLTAVTSSARNSFTIESAHKK